MSIVKIKKNSDPFKKYWWVILFGFGGVGAWICMPLMDTSVGSGSVRPHGLSTENQSLDSISNPSGAPGAALDMPDSAYGKKKGDSQPIDSLYQSPAEPETGAAAAGAPLTGAAAASFADALKAVSAKTAPAGSWKGEKPQAGFTAPKGNFSSLSGLGSSSGGSGASAAAPSSGAFGTNVAKTAFDTTRGLGAGSGAGGPGAKPIMAALQGAASQGQLARSTKSADLSHAIAGGIFDGKGAGTAVGGGPSQGLGGTYSDLDAAPADLKANDPSANSYQDNVVPQYAAPDTGTSMAQAIMMMVVSAVVGGVVTGVTNSIFGTGAAAGAGSQSALALCTTGMVPGTACHM